MQERGFDGRDHDEIGKYLAEPGYLEYSKGMQRRETSRLAVDFCWITRILEADERVDEWVDVGIATGRV